jgi:uncharacterized protein (DUF2236 family)
VTPATVTDRGLFGPDSVTWRVHSNPTSALVGGLRALLIQSLHPLAMAGVAEHSDYRRRPLGRLQRTAEYVATTTFGTLEQAEAAAARVRRVHRRVHGTDPVTGRPYSAEDPETQAWIHTVEVHSFLAAHRVYGAGRLTRAEEDRYFAENVRVAALLGTPPGAVPASVEEARAFFARMRPGLCVSDAARDAISFVAEPPLTPEMAPYWVPLRILGRAAVALVPRDLRRLAGLDAGLPGNAAAYVEVQAARGARPADARSGRAHARRRAGRPRRGGLSRQAQLRHVRQRGGVDAGHQRRQAAALDDRGRRALLAGQGRDRLRPRRGVHVAGGDRQRPPQPQRGRLHRVARDGARVGQDDAVAPGRLGVVERAVDAHEVGPVVGGARGHERRADRDGDRQVLAADAHRLGGDAPAHGLADGEQRGGLGDAAHDDEELLAAHPQHRVLRAHARAQPFGHGDQHGVARGVAVEVVDGLEVVEVDGQQAERAVGAAGEHRAERAAVGDAREVVDVGQAVGLGLRGEQHLLHVVDLGDVEDAAVQEPAAALVANAPAVAHPAHDAVRADEPVLDVEAPVHERAVVGQLEAPDVVGVHVVAPDGRARLLHRHAEELLPARAGEDDPVAVAGQELARVDVLLDRAEDARQRRVRLAQRALAQPDLVRGLHARVVGRGRPAWSRPGGRWTMIRRWRTDSATTRWPCSGSATSARASSTRSSGSRWRGSPRWRATAPGRAPWPARPG